MKKARKEIFIKVGWKNKRDAEVNGEKGKKRKKKRRYRGRERKTRVSKYRAKREPISMCFLLKVWNLSQNGSTGKYLSRRGLLARSPIFLVTTLVLRIPERPWPSFYFREWSRRKTRISPTRRRTWMIKREDKKRDDQNNGWKVLEREGRLPLK